ncbi:SGNH hydrolase-type esterase domain-containing protein [Penicillium cataractarum]|uniref:SGNH hydrolase-type esterase domain-containing protein n=1 Tax=Penicillium cataractarum TaxID=2100454 RepID=A0A9W9RFB7_9EURO|nr:SGNH hydrolase-type esterase domain-containing protein [Penicillium cataractarum]KAJ5359061.1 SGNH hydrolase-type esterase domain-containing protein [Penicillium cataractarum]
MVTSHAGFPRSLVSLLASISLLAGSVNGYPFIASSSDLLERDHKPFELKLWPVGASITWGQHSQSRNGYRKPLRDELVSDGWDVDMVGSQHHGNMTDDNVEGYPGATIATVQTKAMNALPTLPNKPNLVLINAGTNDCRKDLNITGAGDRMEKMIDAILKEKDMETATIILSTLIPSDQKEVKAHRDAVNEQYRKLVTAMSKKGTSIRLAEMENALSWPQDYTVDGKADDTHPSDAGYAKMAKVWFEAIKDAYRDGIIKATGTVTSPNTVTEVISVESAVGVGPGVEVEMEVVTETITVS